MSHDMSVAQEPSAGPGYEQPWQAQAFACAVQMSRAGLFTWADWTRAFGEEIRLHPQGVSESPLDAYYRQLLDALERLIRDRSLLSGPEIARRVDLWRQAYLNTPHGHPVELENALRSHQAAGVHHHEVRREPVAVSPAQGQGRGGPDPDPPPTDSSGT